jgi:hypothetical protein
MKLYRQITITLTLLLAAASVGQTTEIAAVFIYPQQVTLSTDRAQQYWL